MYLLVKQYNNICKYNIVLVFYIRLNMDNKINIYKGKYYNTKPNAKNNKVMVFDVDETFGSFFELKILWDYISTINPKLTTSKQFNELLDLYPEFLRYGIIPIIDYIYQKKMAGECYKVYVYTNNQYNYDWVNLILEYFMYKLDCKIKLFDQVIRAFKINSKKIEVKRTTNSKTYDDFIKCTMLPTSTEICFVDNNYFPEMKNERVYYIQPLSYYHNLSKEEIICRFLHSNIWALIKQTDGKNENELYDNFETNFMKNTKIMKQDIRVAQKIMYHIKEFFYFPKNKNKTKKNKMVFTRFTRKKNVTIL